MRWLHLSLLVALLTVSAYAIGDTGKGKMTGGQPYSIPSWFKQSFLDLRADLSEAGTSQRHVMLFLHLNACPYCARMLDENFIEGTNKAFIQHHFDVIAINIRGSQEVSWIDGWQYTETTLARKLNVFATPTIVFIDTAGEKVLQLNGYRAPAPFRQALDYVQRKAYQRQSLASFVESQTAAQYRFRRHPAFRDITDFSNQQKPLAVIFEDNRCADCDEFHEYVLQHPDVLAALSAFTVVRLDAYSGVSIVDTEGRKTTPQRWAETLSVHFRPGVVLFDKGVERARIDGMQYHFHTKELLRYVSGQFYVKYPRFGPYLRVRQQELLDQGVDVDFSR